jgi:hypothetical protein
MNQMHEAVKKSRQHHVWQQYLRAWATDGRLYCLQNGRVFGAGTAVLGLGRDFYKVDALTDKDIELIKLLAFPKNQHPKLRENNARYLRYALALANAAGSSAEAENEELDEHIDAYNTNVVDNHHTFFEDGFAPLLAQSLRLDIGWYENGLNRITFLTFISAQNLRTRRVRDATIARMRDRMGLDISRIWNILAVIFAFNSGFSMFAEPERRSLTLVRNLTTLPFVTGDQPVINLASEGGETPPEVLAFYYPISPRLALYLSEPERPADIPASIDGEALVMDLNLRIARASHSQIYAASANVLEDIRQRMSCAA